MNRILTALLALSLSTSVLLAQDDRLDDLTFEEMPLKDESVPYFAVGVGPTLSLFMPNYDDVNALGTSLGIGTMSGSIAQWGGEIFTAIGVVPNMRVGFSWVTGNNSVSKDTMFVTNGPSYTRSMKYSVSMRTLKLDYAIVPFKSFAIIPGVGIGFGTLTLETYQSAKNRTWADYGTIPATSPDSYSILERSVIYAAPKLDLEYAVTPFLNLRLNASYALQLAGGDWTGNRTAVVSSVPDGIKLQGFSAQFGIFVGLFN